MKTSSYVPERCGLCEHQGNDSTGSDSWWNECGHPSTDGGRCIGENRFVQEGPPPPWCPLRIAAASDCFESIKQQLEGNESVLGVAIRATCDNGLAALSDGALHAKVIEKLDRGSCTIG